MAGRSKPNRGAVKIHHNYTVEDASRVVGVSKGTVRRWLKSGLPSINDRKPVLILGGDLSDFLKARSKPKARCDLTECFCFRCRVPRMPAENMADFIPLKPTGGNLRALCGTCGTLMHKRVSDDQFKALRVILDVSVMEPPAHIRECT